MRKGLELLVDTRNGRLTAAVVRKTQLIDLFIDHAEVAAPWGSIYMGRVAKIDRGLDAAIIELGDGLSGILPGKHAQATLRDKTARRPLIGESLSPGQSVIVQVKSEAKRGTQHEQLKLPRLTTKIVVMGQYSHHTPMIAQTLMSRKIVRGDVVDLVAALKAADQGFLVQTTAELADNTTEIKNEAAALVKIWRTLDTESTTPRLLMPGPHAVARAFIDYSSAAFEHIYVADKDILALMQTWCSIHAPALATSKRLRLFKPEKLGQKLFDFYDVDGAIADLDEEQIFLPSGGNIIIESAHAMVIIDVNQGSTPNIVDANIEAAHAVARQIRVRNLCGAILIDFINMTQRSDRALVLDALEKALADDTAAALVHGFTRIGIVEITRKRRCGMHMEKRIAAQDPAGRAFNKNA